MKTLKPSTRIWVLVGIVAVAVAALIVGILVERVHEADERARTRGAEYGLRSVRTVLLTYRLDTGTFPSVEQGLQALLTPPKDVAAFWAGPYLSRLPVDPWDAPYQYGYPADASGGLAIYSLGADSAPGGDGADADIHIFVSERPEHREGVGEPAALGEQMQPEDPPVDEEVRTPPKRAGAAFHIETVPGHARVRIMDIAPAYQDGMVLAPREYRVEVSAAGFHTKEEVVWHGTSPTTHRVVLDRIEPEGQQASPVEASGPTLGDRFRDCPECPEMVVVPAGSYQMGSPPYEQERQEEEGPVHGVTISAPFAIGRHEVTVAEFGRFVEATGHSAGTSCWTNEDSEWESRAGRSWRNPGFGQSERFPVVCVSWDDAQAYVAWLSQEMGETYRLPSESEWEYAARAGTSTARYWGEGESGQCRHANGGDVSTKERYSDWRWTIASCPDGHVHTAPVGSFAANDWGLQDVLGNVWEWTEDCSNDSYAGAPSDGSAWEYGDCARRVLRGGSWNGSPSVLRAAVRNMITSGFRFNGAGFRVARTTQLSVWPFTVVAEPADAQVRLGDGSTPYRAGMPLPAGEYRVEVGADGYGTRTVTVRHGGSPTTQHVDLRKGPTLGDWFRDCPECPEMVVVPTGSYRMGSPSYKQGQDEEGPVHGVIISAPFAIGRHEVTVAEFGRFVDATGHSAESSCDTYEDDEWEYRAGRSWRNPGFAQSARFPVVCVSWDDAQAYVAWLSRETGKEYRLPSESEWEYAARAGTATARYWGEGESGQCRHANGADASVTEHYSDSDWNLIVASCRDEHVHTAPVGSFAANDWGLQDMLGNVWEWTEDCWNDSYAGAPSDGSAWEYGDCARRVLRGSSWFNLPEHLRAAHRGWGSAAADRGGDSGFRVARTLAP